eukprot:TRINITY_DN7576_c0_g1_i2.p1 TRINITY_DN7576_c0_g1~~TRINITY_DN7576_c0_g1_i2.p1  ORF type:complete len:209 (-),score=18.92 TRINITY_DN7576_c0_g1_i2:292-918(-)
MEGCKKDPPPAGVESVELFAVENPAPHYVQVPAAAVDSHIYYRPAHEDDLPRINALEQESYPSDEAASPSTMQYRMTHAPSFFLVAERMSANGENKIVGYVCSTVSVIDKLAHSTMFAHDPTGSCLCIHSVCVDKTERRKGIGSRLLQAYVRYVAATAEGQIKTIRLLCKEKLVPFYCMAGFSVVGPSDVVHGRDRWIECMMTVPQET